MDQFLTLKRANLGPVFNFTAYIYICCRVKTGPRFGVSSVKTGPSLVLKTGPSFFSLYSVLGIFENTNSVTLCQNSVFAKFWGCQK